MNGKAIRSWQINLLHTKNLRGTMALRTLLGSHPESVILKALTIKGMSTNTVPVMASDQGGE